MFGLALTLLALVLPHSKPQIRYTLRVDPADLSGFAVEMRIMNPPASFTLAAAAHPEYNDRYWRFIENVQSNATIARQDSVLWNVKNASGDVVVKYRVHLPPAEHPRAAWRPFLDARGGLVGGPHAFLYVIGKENAPAAVTLDVPADWQVATGLTTSTAKTFMAPTVDLLIDSPILVGHFSDWRFDVGGVPHRVAYWRTDQSKDLDTLKFVSNLQRYVTQVAKFWGMMPYKSYTFMYQDDAYGGLEYVNSLSMGGTDLDETAHEFFHTWNLMHIKPVEYRGLEYRTQPPVSGLWVSEGFTMLYADLLTRRAGLQPHDSTRVRHLERLMMRYLGSPGNGRFSAEVASRAAYNAGPAALGDYDASTHLQGELIGTMLDLIVRDATDNRRSLDDVMRRMLSDARIFASRDVERISAEVCGCNTKPLFDAYVYNGAPIDFDRYLGLMGMRAVITREPSVAQDGKAYADTRVAAWLPKPDGPLLLRVWLPQSVWARNGLHTGDTIASINGATPRSWPEFRAVLSKLRVGDEVHIVVARNGRKDEVRFTVPTYDHPVVRLEQLPNATAKQVRLRNAWLNGATTLARLE